MRDMTESYETYEEQPEYDWDYDAPEDRGPRPRVMWGRVLSLVVFVIIAFLLGSWMSGGGPSQEDFDALQAQVSELESENTQLETRLEDAQTALQNTDDGDSLGDGTGDTTDTDTNDASELETNIYTVQSGDDLITVLQKEPPTGYGCSVVATADGTQEQSLVDIVADANGPDFTPNRLAAGQEITLPAIPEGYSCAN